MSRQFRVALGCIFVLSLVVFAQSGAGEQSAVKQSFMRAKLLHSQNVLEAITLEDYAGIAKHAEQLRLLSFDEDWQVLHTEEYARLSADFRRSAAGLANAGKSQNLDAAVLAYFQMTHNCVDCHRYMRQSK
ncbi:MAG: hypothetical protein KDA42_18545 [Planctomycetales bacterium]|nr:hypothetical protein [Planctomycetales bacterium]